MKSFPKLGGKASLLRRKKLANKNEELTNISPSGLENLEFKLISLRFSPNLPYIQLKNLSAVYFLHIFTFENLKLKNRSNFESFVPLRIKKTNVEVNFNVMPLQATSSLGWLICLSISLSTKRCHCI